MILHMICNDGSPLGVSVKSLYGQDSHTGVGGSEYLMLTLCEEWKKRGHEVILYNDGENGASCFEQRPIAAYQPNEARDVLINFRSPNPRSVATTNCKKVWLSTDQFSTNDYRAFAPCVDKIVCISSRHAEFFEQAYGIKNTTVIDIPVRMQDFDEVEPIERIKNRLIFTSVPARGLDNLLRIYPIIRREVPDVSLAITSDYRLWGVGPSNEHFRIRWMRQENVSYFGAMPRKDYVRELLKAQILAYPCNYDELFCVSVAEAQYAGVYPITTNCGALPTTNMGTVLLMNPDDPANDRNFANTVIQALSNELPSKQLDVSTKALQRFSPDVVLKQWDEKVFGKG